MLANVSFYEITIIAILAIWNVYFIFSLLYSRLKKLRLVLPIVLVIGALITKVFFTNPVYIINDNNDIQEATLIIPYKYLLNNGQYTILKPEPGLSQIWIINNGSKPAWYEPVIYGAQESSPLERLQILPYSAIKITNIEYFFEAPPKNIKVINPPVTQGWLHR